MARLKNFAAIDIKDILLKLLLLLDYFLGIRMLIAFLHCIGVSSQCGKMLTEYLPKMFNEFIPSMLKPFMHNVPKWSDTL